ncbi:MAG: SH3 domain-containing protein, partial [Anaerolineae bacterium]
MTTVPFISQLNNAPRNDCGPACALMLARSVGKGLTDTVEQWSKELPTARQIDAEDNGTTANELAAMLKKMGCDPVLSPVAPYPYIALVDYAVLPAAQRLDTSGRTFGHWIVRLSDTEYHDPYAAHGNQVADAATLDTAIRTGAGKYWGGFVVKVGIRDTARSLPAALIVTGTDGMGVNVRASGTINAQKIGVMGEGRAMTVVEEQSGWSRIQLVDEPPSWAKGWVKSDYLAANPTRPAPVEAAPRKILVGVNVITDIGALAEAERAGCKFAMVMGANREAADFARNHPDGYCMLRADLGQGRWGADDFIRALGVSADMPPNLVLTLFNEADSWGSSPREMEERMRVEVEFVRKARAMECKAVIALGTFSVGNPQFALGAPEYADTVRLIRQYYAPLWNAG